MTKARKWKQSMERMKQNHKFKTDNPDLEMPATTEKRVETPQLYQVFRSRKFREDFLKKMIEHDNEQKVEKIVEMEKRIEQDNEHKVEEMEKKYIDKIRLEKMVAYVDAAYFWSRLT